MFDGYGPYKLDSYERNRVDELIAAIARDNWRLVDGVGVYLFTAPDESDKEVPVYVGKTYKGYRSRIIRHSRSERIRKLISERGSMKIYLLPRSTPKGRVVRTSVRLRDRGLKSVDWLELELIDHCLKLNQHLLNVSEVRFHKALWVPGFRDSNSPSQEPAAKALRKVLKVK